MSTLLQAVSDYTRPQAIVRALSTGSLRNVINLVEPVVQSDEAMDEAPQNCKHHGTPHSVDAGTLVVHEHREGIAHASNKGVHHNPLEEICAVHRRVTSTSVASPQPRGDALNEDDWPGNTKKLAERRMRATQMHLRKVS